MAHSSDSFWVICRNVSRTFAELCKETPYWCIVLVHQYGRRKSTKTNWSSLFLWKLFLFTRELAYVRIDLSSNTWDGYTAENQEERLFFNETTFPLFWCHTVKTRKFKLLYFRNETCYGNGKLHKDLLFLYLQPSVNKNSWNLAILTLQFDEVNVKTIYSLRDLICYATQSLNV